MSMVSRNWHHVSCVLLIYKLYLSRNLILIFIIFRFGGLYFYSLCLYTNILLGTILLSSNFGVKVSRVFATALAVPLLSCGEMSLHPQLGIYDRFSPYHNSQGSLWRHLMWLIHCKYHAKWEFHIIIFIHKWHCESWEYQ